MTAFLRQNTATLVMVGPIVDSVDASAETAQTIAPADRQLSKNGADYAATSDGSNAVHKASGRYAFTLTATDLNTAGVLRLDIAKSGCALYWKEWTVLPAQVYDAWFVHPLIADAIHYGQFQGGGAAAATLATSAAAVDDRYNGRLLYVYDGTGAGQVGTIQDYVGSSRGCVMAENWDTAVDATSKGIVLPFAKISTLAELGVSLGARIVDGTLTQDQSTRLQNSALFGKVSGAAGTSVLIRNVGDTKNRISATVDASGNRSAVTLDGT